MAGVMQKFLVASMFMWMLPIAILYAFNHDFLPGILTLEPSYNYLLRFDFYTNPLMGFLD